MTYAGRGANGIKRIKQFAYPSIGGVDTILSDNSPR
jgi:hypothetical protein